MVKSKDIFLEQQIVYVQMQESVFNEIPESIRHKLTDWQREPDDYNELKKDETFCKLYKDYRDSRKKLNDYKHYLRNK